MPETLNARLSDVQKAVRNGAQIPIHGPTGELGVLNVIAPGQVDGETDVVFGSRFIQEVSLHRGRPAAVLLPADLLPVGRPDLGALRRSDEAVLGGPVGDRAIHRRTGRDLA
ncbi:MULTISPECIES: hypothetical protein [Streptomyces]|uniref:Uncharacterized protein n=1 Tax=Streptomyces canarius TaxID=285453 RepID=A0ABQ3CLH8_9ACTN|nr:hypothetical protein [Streptomyces canarius]GHA14394.1 hypothetical protein GCM10010345_18670 [Streptomyces canarius]